MQYLTKWYQEVTHQIILIPKPVCLIDGLTNLRKKLLIALTSGLFHSFHSDLLLDFQMFPPFVQFRSFLMILLFNSLVKYCIYCSL